jgi:Uri superfamily endonuclease
MNIEKPLKLTGKTYILVIENYKERNVKIGRLGELHFPAGIYAYIGSGKKNLIARIKRHLSTDKKKFWHIDYFLDGDAGIKEIWISPEGIECKTARFFIKNGFHYIRGFGSSDCKCKSHLFYGGNSNEKIINILKKNYKNFLFSKINGSDL